MGGWKEGRKEGFGIALWGKEGGPGQGLWRKKSYSVFHDFALSESHILETEEDAESGRTSMLMAFRETREICPLMDPKVGRILVVRH